MERWAIAFEFADKKRCLDCPLRDWNNDDCKMQLDLDGETINFGTWEEQMESCPLQAIPVKDGEKE